LSIRAYVLTMPVLEQSITPDIGSNSKTASRPSNSSRHSGLGRGRCAHPIPGKARLAVARLDFVAASPFALSAGVPSAAPTSKTHKPAGRHFMLRSAGRSLGPAARPRLTTATPKRLSEFTPRRALPLQARPLAIPLRQVEMRIRDKTCVDKTPLAIYSSLTIDDHSVDRFGRT
jgi:hypothetical protein